jgi:tRNA dimethylallyltransferase
VATHKTILIAGPTASGKSMAALRIAQASGGVIINADALQVYRDLRIITARPSPHEEKLAPHRLYGDVDADAVHSTGAWLRDAARLLEARDGRPLIFCGGTGLYFEAMTRGLADIPAVPAEVIDALRAELAAKGLETLRGELRPRDPASEARIKPGDAQRVLRALGVLRATGKPMSWWQEAPQSALLPPEAPGVLPLVILPERAVSADRIAARLQAMVEAGALEEVSALRARCLPADRPCLRAIGVAEFGAALDGTNSLSEAIDRAVIATRQYAKRQRSWFRNRMDSRWNRVADTDSAIQIALDFLG